MDHFQPISCAIPTPQPTNDWPLTASLEWGKYAELHAGRSTKSFTKNPLPSQGIGVTSEELLLAAGNDRETPHPACALKCLQKHWKNWQEKSSMWHQQKKKLLKLILRITENTPCGPKQSEDSGENSNGTDTVSHSSSADALKAQQKPRLPLLCSHPCNWGGLLAHNTFLWLECLCLKIYIHVIPYIITLITYTIYTHTDKLHILHIHTCMYRHHINIYPCCV